MKPVDASERSMHVVHVLFQEDAMHRTANDLLDTWTTLTDVAASVVRAGAHVTVVLPGAHAEVLVRQGVTFHFTPPARFPGPAFVQRSRVARSVIDTVCSLAPDLVHLHGFTHPLAARRLRKAIGNVPLLVQDHGGRAPRGSRRIPMRWGFRGIDGAAFTGREQAMRLVTDGVLPAAVPVFDIVEGSSRFSPGDRDASRAATGIAGDPCFLMAGRLNAGKDPLTAIEAFERAAELLPNARLYCCYSDATLLDAVRVRIAQSARLRDRVSLLGHRPHAEMEVLYRAADFLVQASHHEGAGYALIEALACGTTPIVTDIPAARRIVGAAGSLTAVRDSGALARAMVEWAGRDRARQRAMARERFERALTYDAIGRDLVAAYRQLGRAS